ncbi:MAG: hypothetical protein JAZ07_24185, partial [Candidatus Thiodiazotropha endolucinida]|nr:hypothetical protein [Candidatus Thiodiazotropha taylori]
PKHDPNHRDHRDEGDKVISPLCACVAQADIEFDRFKHSSALKHKVGIIRIDDAKKIPFDQIQPVNRLNSVSWVRVLSISRFYFSLITHAFL